MEEKLSTIYLRDGRNALLYVMSLFETGLSTQQYGDNRQSTRTAEEEECLRLIKIAKEQGLYIDKSDWGKFGDRRMIPTGATIHSPRARCNLS